ncbi:hypothetical protein BGW38_005275, partial [Lunasporangiospora selenospora]
TLAKSNINWNKMWLAVCNVMNTALTNTQEGIRAVYEWLIMLVEQFFKTGDWVLERALENLKRAKSSARVVKGRAGHRLEVIADRLAAKMTRKDTDDGGRHPKDGPARQWSKKIKTILKESERKVEEVMQNEFVQGVGQKLHEKLETLQSSPTGQKVGQKLHKKLEKFQSTSVTRITSRIGARSFRANVSPVFGVARPIPTWSHGITPKTLGCTGRSFHASFPSLRERPPTGGGSNWGDLMPSAPRNGGGSIAVLGGGYYIAHLETVPMTGRRRFIDVSVRQEEKMAKEAYKQVMSMPSTHCSESSNLGDLNKAILPIFSKYCSLLDLDWEFHVIDSDEKNAFVMPGGKVFVFTGILPIAQNEDGLATVLGHEIAHQLARHSAEKLSFTKVALFLGVMISLVFDPSLMMQRLIMDLGMMLPFSRKCETEADQIGLQLMAQACFDPRESIKMWGRMHAQERGPSIGFLNTHPTSKNRIVKLEEWMPEALDTWHKSDCATTNAYAQMFNRSKLASW